MSSTEASEPRKGFVDWGYEDPEKVLQMQSPEQEVNLDNFDWDSIIDSPHTGRDLLEFAEKGLNPNVIRGVKRGSLEASYTVEGGAVLVFGDLHLSSKYEGKHIDYMGNCIRVMMMIMEIAKEEKRKNGLAAIILLGDVFGVKERNLNDPRFKSMVITFFQVLNRLTDNNVYSVRGNHDFGDYPEFNQFELLGLIKNPDWVDYKFNGKDELRFHIMNYGNEDMDIPLIKNAEGSEDASDVVLAHNDFYVDGVTTWYAHGDKVIHLATKRNFIGVDLLVVGHIHNPSPEKHVVSIYDKHQLALEYPGCPTRVSQRYDDCYYMRFYAGEGTGGATEVERKNYGLWPASEEFLRDSDDELYIPVTKDEMTRRERLSDIMETIRQGQFFNGDPRSQLLSFPGASKEAKVLAAKYYDQATNVT